MATNRAYPEGDQLTVAPTGATVDPPTSGDPIVFGQRPGVCLTDSTDTIANAGEASVQFDGVFNLDVSGRSDDGTAAVDAAITAGDIVYLDDADNQINADDNNGVRFGYAMQDVAAGATTTIEVIVGY